MTDFTRRHRRERRATVGQRGGSARSEHRAEGAGQAHASQRLDELEDNRFAARSFEHCTFANVSFKTTTLERCEFVDCAFIDCYFRDTTLRNCRFVACKFEDCSFSGPVFEECSFIFPVFRGCFVPFDQFKFALPVDAGLRYKMADELAREAAIGGSLGDARRYRLKGEAAYERHLWNLAWASGGPYYEKKRPPLTRVKSATSWIGRKFNRYLWGYGERGLALLSSFLLVGAGLFPLLFWSLTRDDATRNGKLLGLGDYWLFSADNLLSVSGFSNVVIKGSLVRWLVAAEAMVGLLFVGLFISLVFNWIRRR